jgi:hypothetical protein
VVVFKKLVGGDVGNGVSVDRVVDPGELAVVVTVGRVDDTVEGAVRVVVVPSRVRAAAMPAMRTTSAATNPTSG